MTTTFTRIGRPGALGSRKQEVYGNYDALYGKEQWRLVWDVQGKSVDLAGALALYEDAYFEYFQHHPDQLEWLVENFADVYDNNPSNVHSGFDYAVQEFGGNHFQDIAIRRCLLRNGLWFKGTELLEIRLKGDGALLSPINIPFHKHDLIPQPEIQGWWKPGSVESWYQSARYLEVRNPQIDLSRDVYFVTSNKGKVASAQRSLGDLINLGQITLDISEEQDSVEAVALHKAKVAHAVLCRPVLCDDSGFVIHSLSGYPGNKVGRELQTRGIEHFTALARDQPLDASFVMSLAYLDISLKKPQLFTSTVDGNLISEVRGDLNKPFIKSPLAGCFILHGQTKTIAEMTEAEYKQHATTDRWKALAIFLQQHRM